MAIELISKIKQKNSGQFFLVDAADIDVKSGAENSSYPGTSLENFLNAIPSDKVMHDDKALSSMLDDLKAADDAVSIESTNPVQNKAITNELYRLVGETPVSEQISDAIDKISFPVTSVNGQSGEVKLSASDVNALPADTTIPSIVGLATEKYVDEAVGGKVDKVDGKDLSTNDYTTNEKNKLANIEDGANKTVVDTTLTQDSVNPVQGKAIFAELSRLVGDTTVSEQINAAIAQKFQVQIITWGDDD